jgi:NAD(P)-dependent dehydrogenase (short-subunit alcohol dehydrogenase family)
LTDESLRARVAGRVVLITGGSSGIGKATAFKLAAAGATTIIAARGREQLEMTKREAAEQGLTFFTYIADITEPNQCKELASRVLAGHGAVDILINNAGKSIRRSVDQTVDRVHDLERTMRVNYFGSVDLTLALLPSMCERRQGHIVNISSIAVLTNAPRFSAYVASKAALEAWMRCAASEYLDRNIHFSIVNLPLVRTPMIAPTKIYEHAAVLSPEQAADMIATAILNRSARVATRLGIFGQIVYALAPQIGLFANNALYQVFPESAAPQDEKPHEEHPTMDQILFSHLFPGIHV